MECVWGGMWSVGTQTDTHRHLTTCNRYLHRVHVFSAQSNYMYALLRVWITYRDARMRAYRWGLLAGESAQRPAQSTGAGTVATSTLKPFSRYSLYSRRNRSSHTPVTASTRWRGTATACRLHTRKAGREARTALCHVLSDYM